MNSPGITASPAWPREKLNSCLILLLQLVKSHRISLFIKYPDNLSTEKSLPQFSTCCCNNYIQSYENTSSINNIQFRYDP